MGEAKYEWETELRKPISNDGASPNTWMEAVENRTAKKRPAQARGVALAVGVSSVLIIIAMAVILQLTNHNRIENFTMNTNDIGSVQTIDGLPGIKGSPDDIESVQIIGGLPGTKGSPIYQKADENGNAVVAKIAGWLRSAKPANGPTNFGKHGYPMIANLTMNDGRIITAEPAFDCITTTNSDGSGTSKTCTRVNHEIVLSDGSNANRLNAPGLYDWITEGWKQELSEGEFTQADAIKKATEYHNQAGEAESGVQFPTDIRPGQSVSRDFTTGGKAPGTTLNLVLTVDVKTDHNKLIVTLTEDYNIKVNGTKAISHWTYEVSADAVRLIDKKEDGNSVLLIK